MDKPLKLAVGPGAVGVPESLGAIGDLLEGLSAEARASVSLIVSELVESAARLDRRLPVLLSMKRNGNSVRCRMDVDTRRWKAPPVLARLDGSAAGLFDVADYSWGIVAGSGVWFELTDPREVARPGYG